MMVLYKLAFIITAFGAVLITLNVILKKRQTWTKFDIFYALMAVSLSIWALGRLGLLLSQNYDTGLFWVRFLYIGSILVHILFLHTVLVFLDLDKKRKYILFIFYANAAVLLFFNVFDLFTGSNYFIKDIVAKLNFQYFEVPNTLYNLHLVDYIFIPFYALIEMVFALKRLSGEKLQQLRFIIVASIFGFLGGNSVVPLVYDIPLEPFLVILVPFHLLILTYAIARHHLFEIRVIATELLTFAIWIFVLIRLFLAETLQERLINGGLLLILIIFGILLVRSVLKEVRSREEIEKLAKELEKANVRLKELDQAKSEFVTIASHQLRAPITAVKGYASMVLEGTKLFSSILKIYYINFHAK
ncbi:MAG: histidine kinase N-terminal 7TM domain-containing protein [Patescibacteria group bacterium]